ncbi:PHP domain-containing protein [Methanofollis formosanus]|uniref:PHP domain-containing protein n=1 Tax=Methanofollis formosanus TaxID=299308 RepID=A0A8G1A325_9EURY|nr:PHP domain-containing protein [Methanofollis formosanus]QYZ79823.1 PHP domain-containing protein [Methanofollis formosanus]
MKIWKKYSQYLLSGEWHIHTSYTDGESSVDDYCKRAVELGIPLIVFTEHVRHNLSYDFNAYMDDIDNAREKYDLIILSGCEAKVLPDGTLDVDDDILKQVDYPIFAFHSFPRDIDIYLDALYDVLRNPYVNTWAHPGVFLKRSGLYLSEKRLYNLFKNLNDNDTLIEQNMKYNAPPEAWLNITRRCRVNYVRGSDCHRVGDLKLVS